MAKRKLEPWEEKLAAEGEAIRRMKDAGPTIQGKRIVRTRLNHKKTTVATVSNRDRAAVHVGFAPDRIYG